MKSKIKTYAPIILDRSGSMARNKVVSICGFNEQVQQLKEDANTQEILCSLITFNGEVYEHLWNVPAEQLAEADPKDYIPNGKTAMRDAVGYVVQKLLDTTDHEDPNVAYLITTITDGESWDDRHYNATLFAELCQSCEATNKWTFAYIGCDKNSLKGFARQTGASVANMAAWSNATPEDAKRGFRNIRSRQKKYFAERAMGQTKASHYASDTDTVADFMQEAVAAVAAPVILDPQSFCPRQGLLSSLPQYAGAENYPNLSNPYNGQALFANSTKVEWITPKVSTTLHG